MVPFSSAFYADYFSKVPVSYSTNHHDQAYILLTIIGFLAESDFLDDLSHIVTCFDKTTKLRFRSADEPQFVKFGSTRDNDEDCNIRYGQLKMTG
jgi:hypothetical protein